MLIFEKGGSDVVAEIDAVAKSAGRQRNLNIAVSKGEAAKKPPLARNASAVSLLSEK